MQSYAPTSSSVSSTTTCTYNHQRSLSLCNYDELCRFRKRKMTLDVYDQEAPENCELCPLNSNELCEHHKKPNADPSTSCEVNLMRKSTVKNQMNYKNRSTIIDMTNSNDQSLKKYLPLPLPIFTCSSFLSPEQQIQSAPQMQLQKFQLHSAFPSQNLQSTSPVRGHRRSLSLKQQFEVSYDYLWSEIVQAKEFAGKTVTTATKTVSQATGAVWKVCHFSNLPKWMQDNEYLHSGHRPPLPTFWACIKSIFRLHTETGNIWTHGLGALLFMGLFIYEFVTISAHKTAVDRLMLTIYFCGIILCLLFSCLFHTFSCYASPKVIKIFSKLDYCGISLQIIGSMTPALYYGFYEDLNMFKLYISFGIVLCILSIIVSMWDKFGEPQYRSFRAIVFLCFGLSNVIPGVHWYIVLDSRLLTAYYMFILQGALYVIGSLLYANRIPERMFPGKCDYMFQSHQIFHVLVVLAALVHLNGINSMAEFRIYHRIHPDADKIITSTTSSLVV